MMTDCWFDAVLWDSLNDGRSFGRWRPSRTEEAEATRRLSEPVDREPERAHGAEQTLVAGR